MLQPRQLSFTPLYADCSHGVVRQGIGYGARPVYMNEKGSLRHPAW